MRRKPLAAHPIRIIGSGLANFIGFEGFPGP